MQFKCDHCGVGFKRKKGRINKRNYCSKPCADHGKEVGDSVKYFWDRVQKTDSCWFWKLTPYATGYGMCQIKGRRIGAHVLSWEIHNGPVPSGMNVCHNCPGGDNPGCINPAHLFLGTDRDNHLDAFKKGRRGKLKPFQVQEIRNAMPLSFAQKLEFSARFRVSLDSVRNVVNGRTWYHI